METITNKSMHPLTAIAAVSVTLFSLVGIAAITGLIPTSHSQTEQVQASAPAKLAAANQASATETAHPVAESKPADKPVAHKAAVKHTRPVEKVPTPAAEPAKTVKDNAPVSVAQNDPIPGIYPPPPPRVEPTKPICNDCGVIQSVREVEKQGEGSGLGAVAGGIAGGVLGHQTGAGRGRDVMTVLGALGGAFAGHQVEKNAKKMVDYQITIRFDDGSSRLITQETAPTWRSGDRVRLANGVITANNTY